MPAACADPVAAGRGGAVRLAPFRPEHLLLLDMGEADQAVLAGFDLVRCAASWPPGQAWSLVGGDRVLGCGGFLVRGDEAVAWMLLSDSLRRRPLVLHRTARRVLAAAPRFRRLRATVAGDFAPGHRWIQALGFRPVCELPAYGPNGETFMEYER